MNKLIIMLLALSAFFFSFVHAQYPPSIAVYFKVVPSQVASVPADLNFKLSFSSSVLSQCPNGSFLWSVESRYQDSQGDFYRLIKTGSSLWPVAGSPVVLDFTQNISPVGNPRFISFLASADCDTYVGGGLVSSSWITIENLSGDSGFIINSNNGTDQNVNFGITNPVIGNPNNVLAVGLLIANWIFNIVIPIAVGLFIYAGFRFVTSRGNPGGVQEGKRLLWYTIIGLAIVLIGKGFIVLIQSILG